MAQVNILDQYEVARGWALSKTMGASGMLDRETPCETWDVRSVLNHMLDTPRYFIGPLTETRLTTLTDGARLNRR